MFSDPFNKCPTSEIDAAVKRLAKAQPEYSFRTDGLAVLRKTLGFYNDAIYYDLTQADLHPPLSLQLVLGKTDDQILVLDGTSGPVLEFNRACPLKLDRHQVMDYARFYLAHVTGPHGITAVIDMVDDLNLREEPTPSLRKSLHDKIVPLALNGSLPGAGYQLRGTLLIKRSLYSALIDVSAAGEITATPSRVLADILPVHDTVLEG
jgi:hypothetical protein